MPTQRPFFANFLASFRAHSAIQQQSQKGPSSSTQSTAHSNTATSSNNAPSNPRTITTSTKTGGGATTTALSNLHSPRALSTSTSPLSTSPSPEQNHSRYMERRTVRRGSDSSSEGFRDVLGAEKWYIGGRTAAGEEKFFKLGVVRRQRSGDRLSLDRLSL
ncbi:hypothetical protein BP6252_13601 [Coleophoma cylindrospora]|uniref:Uncharacterized protein n=1 Tax=Coleophoma cylindrospora TaxID=1849047 RepID=A0A3D8Q952_9HELO|nr:hypothetical protein BP6252_13601 [Coleophoma cylindrospora]